MKIFLHKFLLLVLIVSLVLPAFSTFSSAEGSKKESFQQSNSTEKKQAASTSDCLNGQPIIDRLNSSDKSISVLYNRHYSEGWNYSAGFTLGDRERENTFELTYDFASDINVSDASYKNYFFKITQRNSMNGFMLMSVDAFSASDNNKLYLEFDIKSSENADIPGIFEFVNSGVKLDYSFVASINSGSLYVLDTNVGKLSDKWCHVALEIDYSYGQQNGKTQIKYTAIVGNEGKRVERVDTISNTTVEEMRPFQIRIGRCGAYRGEAWYGLDNLRVYGATGFAKIDSSDFGSLIDVNSTKDFQIDAGVESMPTVAEIAENALNMKVNSQNSLENGVKTALISGNDGNAYGAPFVQNGKIFVPLEPILRYTEARYRFNSDGMGCDFYVSGKFNSVAANIKEVQSTYGTFSLTATPYSKVQGGKNVLYVCLDDVEKLFLDYYVTYDEVGFISISRYKDYLLRDRDEEYMRDLMKRFVYDPIDEASIYDTVKEQTNNFDHPYMYANQERYDYLYDVYHSEPGDLIYDKDLYSYIDDAVKYAEPYYLKYANVNEKGEYLGLKLGKWVYNSDGFASWSTESAPDNHSVSIAPYPDSGGYDPAGGRLNVLSDGENCLSIACEAVAFAYQVTRNESYARFVYDWALALSSWSHWAPGHYLNTAITARNIAISYDLLYDAWVELGLDTAVIRDNIHRLCTYTAWRSLNGLSVEFPRKQGDASSYWSHTGNWNPVSNSGVLPSALISLENPEYIDTASYVISKSVYFLGQKGFNYFAFDGSYRESAGYWSATVRFSQYCIITIKNAFGKDFGLSCAPGLDLSNNFGSHMESSDYVSWNYHDDWIINMPSYWYYMAAELFNKPEYAALRYYHINNGKPTYRWDALFYDKDMIKRGQVVLPLDYVMDSIDSTVSRDSWDKGALYVGIMGGVNNVAHGQYDSGNWIYENNGLRWFCDLGADDYNLYGGGLSKGYYRYSAEGNNTIAITSRQTLMPHGQIASAGGEIISAAVNEYGSATVIDQSMVYGGKSVVEVALRGMLLTNDRRTVVIQDEIRFKSVESLYWITHYSTDVVDKVTFADDNRTAYFHHGLGVNKKVIRVTLLSDNKDLEFELVSAYELLLEDTPKWGYSGSMNGISESSRDKYMRLAIKAENVTEFNVAVVIEEYDENYSLAVGYGKDNRGASDVIPTMSSWLPAKDLRTPAALPEVPTDKFEIPTLSSIILNSQVLSYYLSCHDCLSKYREEFFKALTELKYALQFYSSESYPEIIEINTIIEGAKERYDSFEEEVNKASDEVSSIAGMLIGVKQ